MGKNLTKLKKSLTFKKFHGNVYSVNYDDLDIYDYNYDFADDDECRKIGSVRTLFNEFDRDYYKPIRTDYGLMEEKLITWNIRIEEIDMKIYHQNSILT